MSDQPAEQSAGVKADPAVNGEKISTANSGDTGATESIESLKFRLSKALQQRDDVRTQLGVKAEADEDARLKKMEEDGKLKELLTEQDKVIEILKVKADAGEQLLKDQHTRLLEQLPEDDREDFADLPINQLAKVVSKLKATESIRPEIPSVKGAVKGESKPLKNFWSMNKEDQDANWNDTVDGYIQRNKLNKT